MVSSDTFDENMNHFARSERVKRVGSDISPSNFSSEKSSKNSLPMTQVGDYPTGARGWSST